VVAKASCDAFFETELAAVLTLAGVDEVIVAGCITQYCIDTTCRRAVTTGFDVILVADAHMNAGGTSISYRQVIEHHNAVLDGLRAGAHAIRVVPSDVLYAELTARSI
jgi:nicotinamidase-related amidase